MTGPPAPGTPPPADCPALASLVQVLVTGEPLATTHRPALIIETGVPPRWYIPPGDVRRDRLTPSPHYTTCQYKGLAHYWTVDGTHPPLPVWSYPEPLPEAASLAGLIGIPDDDPAVQLLINAPQPATRMPLTHVPARLAAGSRSPGCADDIEAGRCSGRTLVRSRLVAATGNCQWPMMARLRRARDPAAPGPPVLWFRCSPLRPCLRRATGTAARAARAQGPAQPSAAPGCGSSPAAAAKARNAAITGPCSSAGSALSSRASSARRRLPSLDLASELISQLGMTSTGRRPPGRCPANPAEAEPFWDLTESLRARGKAIVIITHLVFEQDRFDLLADLSGGRLTRRAAPGRESHDRR